MHTPRRPWSTTLSSPEAALTDARQSGSATPVVAAPVALNAPDACSLRSADRVARGYNTGCRLAKPQAGWREQELAGAGGGGLMSRALGTDSGLASLADAKESWAVRGGDVRTRLDSWSEILAATHLAFEVTPTPRTPTKFAAKVVRRPIGDLTLVDCAAGPFRGHRGNVVIGAHGPGAKEDVLGFQYVCKGSEIVRDQHGQRAVAEGDIALWDGRQPTDIEILQPFYKRTLLFPRQRVVEVCPRLSDLGDVPLLNNNSTARLLVRYLGAVVAELPQLEPTAVTAAANLALELLRTVIEPELPTSRDAQRSAMRADIRRYVRAHLADPDLGPTSLSRAFSISVRALHALFEDGDTSVAVLIRSERLHRCFEDLKRPNGGTVTEIALRWGFWETAHFSRVFKKEFDKTPREVRHAAVTSGQAAGL